MSILEFTIQFSVNLLWGYTPNMLMNRLIYKSYLLLLLLLLLSLSITTITIIMFICGRYTYLLLLFIIIIIYYYCYYDVYLWEVHTYHSNAYVELDGQLCPSALSFHCGFQGSILNDQLWMTGTSTIWTTSLVPERIIIFNDALLKLHKHLSLAWWLNALGCVYIQRSLSMNPEEY